jgi:hypothetical protein
LAPVEPLLHERRLALEAVSRQDACEGLCGRGGQSVPPAP